VRQGAIALSKITLTILGPAQQDSQASDNLGRTLSFDVRSNQPAAVGGIITGRLSWKVRSHGSDQCLVLLLLGPWSRPLLEHAIHVSTGDKLLAGG
jgi:hypothetical protein